VTQPRKRESSIFLHQKAITSRTIRVPAAKTPNSILKRNLSIIISHYLDYSMAIIVEKILFFKNFMNLVISQKYF